MERKLFLESSTVDHESGLIKNLWIRVDLQLLVYSESTAVRSTGLTLISNHLWSDNIMLLPNFSLAQTQQDKTMGKL